MERRTFKKNLLLLVTLSSLLLLAFWLFFEDVEDDDDDLFLSRDEPVEYDVYGSLLFVLDEILFTLLLLLLELCLPSLSFSLDDEEEFLELLPLVVITFDVALLALPELLV